MTSLQVLTEVHRKLASIRSVSEAKDLRDRAEAVRRYYKASQQGLQTQNHAAHVKLLCERRAGELLSEEPRQRGHRDGNRGLRAMLAQSGIPETTARRWQYLARYPEVDLLRLVSQCNSDGDELTTALVVQAARAYLERQEEERAAPSPSRRSALAGTSPVDLEDEPEPEPEPQSRGRGDKPNESAQDKTHDARATRERLHHLRELFETARDMCEGVPELAAIRGTLTKWIADITKREARR